MAIELKPIEIDTSDLRKIVDEKTSTLLDMHDVGVKATFYWDSHGKKIPWEHDGKKSLSRYFKHVRLTSTVRQVKWKYIDDVMEEEYWHLDADGERLDLGEITSYSISGNELRLKCCVGAG